MRWEEQNFFESQIIEVRVIHYLKVGIFLCSKTLASQAALRFEGPVLTSPSVTDPMALLVSVEMTRRSAWVRRTCDASRGEWLEKLLLFLPQQWCGCFCWSLS